MERRLKRIAETVKQVEGTYPTQQYMDRLRTDMEKCEGTSVCTPTPTSKQPTVKDETAVCNPTCDHLELIGAACKGFDQQLKEQQKQIDFLIKSIGGCLDQINKLQETCSYLLSRDRSDSDSD
jgi:uncharacterized cysteine cluster protein YcgN (CxxCxxCC family)